MQTIVLSLFMPKLVVDTTMATTRTSLAITFIFLGLLFIASNAFSDTEYALYSDMSESLLPGQTFVYDMTSHGIPYGPHKLSLQRDCNLILYNNNKLVWSTNTSRASGENCYLTLLPDGELVLRENFHYPVWSSGVKSTPGSYVFLLNWNGKLGVFGPELWSNTDETVLSESDPWNTTADYFLFSYQVTPASYGILVTFKKFQLVLTEECDLVLKNINTGKILWQTNTHSPYRDCFTYLDERGELFIKHNRRDILWRSGKRADKAAQYPKTHALAIRYDGRLVIYHPQIWSVGPGVSSVVVGVKEGSSMAGTFGPVRYE